MKTHDRNDLKLGTVVLNTVSQPTDSGFTWLGTGFKFRELVLICISRECTYLLRTAVCVRSGSKWANIHHNADSVWVEPYTLPSVEVPQLQHGSHLHVCQLPGVGFGFSSWTVSVIIINIIIIIITPCLKKLTTFVFMITLAKRTSFHNFSLLNLDGIGGGKWNWNCQLPSSQLMHYLQAWAPSWNSWNSWNF